MMQGRGKLSDLGVIWFLADCCGLLRIAQLQICIQKPPSENRGIEDC